MLLCIDIGNTNIKLGIFEGEVLRCRWRIATDRSRLADEYAMLLLSLMETEALRASAVTGCAISSVVPVLGQEFADLSRRYLHQEPRMVKPGAEVSGMKVNTDYPAEVGPDLVMNALAARQLYKPPLIIIGFGTATTFVAVSAQGNFEGVAIAPGIATGGESLFRSTATLPQVALTRPQAAVGKNTVSSLQSGLVFGFVGLVEGLVERIRGELGGEARVVATGGLASLIAHETRIIDVVEPDLALFGLRLFHIHHPFEGETYE